MARTKSYQAQRVTDLEYQGNGVIKPDGRVVFVEGVLPGELVDVRVTRRKKDFAFAVPTAMHELSPLRQEPFCAHFADCGGCTWQYLPYAEQARYKGRFVADILARIGGITSPEPLPILECEQDRYYRNKLEFSFSPTRWITEDEVARGDEVPDRSALGFHVRGRFNRVLDVEHCYLQQEPSNEIRNGARAISREMGLSYHDPATHAGFLRSLIVRTTEQGEVMVILSVFEDRVDLAAGFLEALVRAVPRISSAYYVVNPSRNDDLGPHDAVHVLGTRTITERCGPLQFAIHPKSFYQTNTRQAERLYAVVREWLEPEKGDALLDLYCGIGSIGLFLADLVSRVVGVEYVEEAVVRARENAVANGCTHAEFHAGDVRELIASAGREGGALPQTELVVLDPPRAGVHPDVVQSLLRLLPRQIVYVSCKPSTQARDLALLRERYEIRRVQPVDMFPQTFHIESVVDLRRRDTV